MGERIMVFKIKIKRPKVRDPYWKEIRRHSVAKNKKKEREKYLCRKAVDPDD